MRPPRSPIVAAAIVLAALLRSLVLAAPADWGDCRPSECVIRAATWDEPPPPPPPQFPPPAPAPQMPQPNAGTSAGEGQSEGEDKKKKEAEEKEKKEKEDKEKEDEKNKGPENYNVYGQVTTISQWHGPFPAAYTGANSLQPNREFDNSITATLFLGARLWQGAELYFNPEVAGGSGFSNVTGIAGFPNGDIFRVNEIQPTPYIARWYATQTFNLGCDCEKVESGPNQLAGCRDTERITVALGKMAATDWFDQNRYSHDPRTQFMNWSLMYNGAWDFPANVRGYDYGGVIEFNFPKMALRYGLFGEPSVANGSWIDGNFGAAHGQVVELENRYQLCCRPGKLRSMFYWNRAHMGNYGDALALSPVNPDVTQTRSFDSVKYGFGINLEQELSDDLGGFFRFGWDDGHTETWAFTAIDRSVAMGLLLKGRRWCRPQDEVGLAWVINGLAPVHRLYLEAGGLDFIIGDGPLQPGQTSALNYGQEVILETYYRYELKKKQIWLSPDFQFVENPAYNRDRGPVAIGQFRLHAEF
jgi:high affinity Mn2+ porin